MSNYEVPKWAGKGPSGLHLDVLKDDKFIQKILIDEKKVRKLLKNVLQSELQIHVCLVRSLSLF